MLLYTCIKFTEYLSIFLWVFWFVSPTLLNHWLLLVIIFIHLMKFLCNLLWGTQTKCSNYVIHDWPNYLSVSDSIWTRPQRAFRCFLTSAYRPLGKHLIQTPFSSLHSDQLYDLVQNYSCNCRKEVNWLSKWKAENKTWQICCWCGWILYGTLAYIAAKAHCAVLLFSLVYAICSAEMTRGILKWWS